MKKWLLLSVILGAMPLTMMAQDDDMYFVPTKEKVAKSTVGYSTPGSTYYSGSNRNVDEYNRRGSYYEPLQGDSLNDIIDFSAVQGVYPDSVGADDFKLTRELSRFDDYQPADGSSAFWAGYSAGRNDSWGWHSPWYYSSAYYPWYTGWYDPWYFDYGWYGGWYDPWYYGWHRPYYGYYGYYGYPHHYYYGGVGYVSRPLRRDSGRSSFGASGRSSFGNGRGTAASSRGRSGFGASRSRTTTSSAASRSTAGSGFGASRSASSAGFGASRSSSSGSSGGSFGGSTRSSGSSGGSFGASGGGGSRSSGGGGGFGRHR